MSFDETYEDQAVAPCSPEQVRLLLPFDHHRVLVQGRPGVMVTYQWMTQEEAGESQQLLVVFHHAEKHPPAPAGIQRLIDELTFLPFKP